AAERPPRLRPQSLMLTYLGDYVLGRDIAVFSGSFIAAFARLGVGEHAVRSTLSRMVARGLLTRHRSGRRMHFGLTPRTEEILRDGEDRVWRQGVVNDDWDGTWTVLAFSMPESWQRVRHDLRARLIWAGFGSLGNGTWIAPSRVDVRPIVAGLGLNGHLKVFTGAAEQPTDVAGMLREAFDLNGLADGYRRFLRRWVRPRRPPAARRAPARGLARRPGAAGGDGAARPLRARRPAPGGRGHGVHPAALIPPRPSSAPLVRAPVHRPPHSRGASA